MTKLSILDRIIFIAIMFLGCVFIWAAMSKIVDLADFAQTLKKITWLPHWFFAYALFIVPSLELVLGLCLLSRIALKEALFASLLLLTLFLFISVQKTLTGTPGCGCLKIRHTNLFEGISGWWIVARDAGLTLFCMLLLVKPQYFTSTNNIKNAISADMHRAKQFDE
jgi:uncharacterized membrane protein YkvI